MEAREYFDWLENNLFRYRYVIGVLILFLLVTLLIATIKNFEKQNQIIKTGGFTDGKIKCVCNQQDWEDFQDYRKTKNSLPNISINGT